MAILLFLVANFVRGGNLLVFGGNFAVFSGNFVVYVTFLLIFESFLWFWWQFFLCVVFFVEVEFIRCWVT